MFLKRIEFTSNVEFESNRKSHKEKFDITTKKYKRKNWRRGGKIETIVEKTFTLIPSGFSMEFKHPVTVIVGDNGCGKTTLLKKIYFKSYQPPFFLRRARKKIVATTLTST